MIKAVIFDLNGVFIKSPKLSDRFKERFNVSENDFLMALKEIMSKVRLPKANDIFSYWKPYLLKWELDLSKKDFLDFWFSVEKEDKEMINFARKLKKKGLKIFILSNNFAERTNYYSQNFHFFNIFDKVYYSWQTGFVKPDIEAYKNILKDNNLKSEEVVYVDDSKENIESASRLGIKGILFENLEQIKEQLDKN